MNTFLAFRVAGAIFPHIPRRLSYALAGWLADVLYSRDVEAVRSLRDNIRHAMGTSATPDHIQQAARRAYLGEGRIDGVVHPNHTAIRFEAVECRMTGSGGNEPGLRTIVAKGDRLGLERVEAELIDQGHGGAGQKQTMT